MLSSDVPGRSGSRRTGTTGRCRRASEARLDCWISSLSRDSR